MENVALIRHISLLVSLPVRVTTKLPTLGGVAIGLRPGTTTPEWAPPGHAVTGGPYHRSLVGLDYLSDRGEGLTGVISAGSPDEP